jgi:shikimate kinase
LELNNNKDNIILTGFMGCGKTTFGKWMAHSRKMTFCDTDEYIEKKQNRQIKDIFAEDGEEFFRKLETETLRELTSSLNHCVIAVGGGLPVREENRKLLKELGTVVYLQTSVDELVRRLKSDTKRPLLAGGDLRAKILELMEKRENIYKALADVIIDTEHKTFEQIGAMIDYANSERQ